MIKEGKIGTQEAVWLLTITITAKVFFTGPAFIAKAVGTAGWYMSFIPFIIVMFVFSLVYKLLKKFPDKNIMEIYDSVLGKPIGAIVSLLLSCTLFITAAANLREFTEVIKIYILPKSPPIYLIGLFVLVVVVLSFLGLETIARFSKLVAYILVTGYVIVLALSIQLYKIHNLFPLLGYGLKETIIHGLKRCSIYGEIIIVGVFACSLQGIKQVKKIGYTSLALSWIIVLSALLAFSLTFPYYMAQETTAPMYLMVSLIRYGEFFQRIDPVFFFIWNISSVISVSVLFYTSLIIYSHVFRLDDKRPIIIPYAIIFILFTIIPINIAQVTYYVVQILREYGWILFFLPPIIILVIAEIKKKKGGTARA